MNKMVPEAELDDCEERKAFSRIWVYKRLYLLRCISLWLMFFSSFYEGCQSDKCFQIHFKQIALCFCLRWVAQLLVGPDLLCWGVVREHLWHYVILPPGGFVEQRGLQVHS